MNSKEILNAIINGQEVNLPDELKTHDIAGNVAEMLVSYIVDDKNFYRYNFRYSDSSGKWIAKDGWFVTFYNEPEVMDEEEYEYQILMSDEDKDSSKLINRYRRIFKQETYEDSDYYDSECNLSRDTLYEVLLRRYEENPVGEFLLRTEDLVERITYLYNYAQTLVNACFSSKGEWLKYRSKYYLLREEYEFRSKQLVMDEPFPNVDDEVLDWTYE